MTIAFVISCFVCLILICALGRRYRTEWTNEFISLMVDKTPVGSSLHVHIDIDPEGERRLYVAKFNNDDDDDDGSDLIDDDPLGMSRIPEYENN